MADAAAILTRVRSYGANVVLTEHGLQVVNQNKLPAGAINFISQNKDAVAGQLRSEQGDEIEERAALIEYDGGAPREWAEQFAKVLISHRPKGISEMDWSWFITRCGQIIDEAPHAMAG